MNRKQLEIMIVEDNPGDALLVTELLEDMGQSIHATIAKDGRVALDMFKKENGRYDGPLPDFVILDLNLPKVNGFDVLSYMKSTTELMSIPVVIMTGSLNKTDEERARCMGVTDYCCKPATIDEMESTAICLKRHLDPLMQRDKDQCDQGPSATMDSYISHSGTIHQGFYSFRKGPSFDDRVGQDRWKICKQFRFENSNVPSRPGPIPFR